MRENYLLFQAYGKKEVKHECLFSLIHLLKFLFHQKVTPVIYTDEPELFYEVLMKFPRSLLKRITKDNINTWRGDINFVHRVKIEIIKDFCSAHNGNLLYCDTDTYFIKSPDELFLNIEKGQRYMHQLEGYINSKTDYQFRKWEKFLISPQTPLKDFSQKQVNQLQMWNAGVIGIKTEDQYLLDDVTSLTDRIYAVFPKHIAEQFAFSFTLQQQGTIVSASPFVFHYWNLKEYASYLEQKIIIKDLDNPLDLLNSIQLPEELLKQKHSWSSKPAIIRFFLPRWKL